MLMHSATNQTAFLLPSSNPLVDSPFAIRASSIGWLTVVLAWVPAVYFLVRMRRVTRRLT
jgi:hypothetical protein